MYAPDGFVIVRLLLFMKMLFVVVLAEGLPCLTGLPCHRQGLLRICRQQDAGARADRCPQNLRGVTIHGTCFGCHPTAPAFLVRNRGSHMDTQVSHLWSCEGFAEDRGLRTTER